MCWSDDPIADFGRWDAEQARKLEKLPKCYECDDPIQDDYCFEFDGEYICESCLKNNHRISVDSICNDW